MARSVWKGPFVDGYLIKKVEKQKKEGKKNPIKIWSRRSTIIPQFVGYTFSVHNGKKFGFEWTVEKVEQNGEFKDCWMTVGVSRPMPLSQAS